MYDCLYHLTTFLKVHGQVTKPIIVVKMQGHRRWGTTNEARALPLFVSSKVNVKIIGNCVTSIVEYFFIINKRDSSAIIMHTIGNTR